MIHCRILAALLALLFVVTQSQAGEAEPPTAVQLIAPKEGDLGWGFNNGAEFPGATGSLSVDADAQREGLETLKLVGDFTQGGGYVEASKKIAGVDIHELTLWIRNPDATKLTLRINDASGQTHQINMKTEARPDWQQVVLPLERFFARRGQSDAVTSVAKYESWGGAKDGRWHGPAKGLYILLGSEGEKKVRTLWLNNVAIVPHQVELFAQPPAFKNDFESATELEAGWTAEGSAGIDAAEGFKSRHSLCLARSLENIARPCAVTSPAFNASPGQWEIGLARKSDLHSPDDSYDGVVSLECLDASGKAVANIILADLFGQHDWQAASKRAEFPKGVVSARFHVQLNKCDGRFWVDDLSAAFLAPARRKDGRIARVLFSTAQTGNLLFPTDPRKVSISVETTRPLRENQRTISYEVRDYWGAEQMHAAAAALADPEKKGNRLVYQASVDLSGIALETGRYYELHAAVPQENEEPFGNYTSFAILPEAETHRYKPEEIPFSSRNWDNRIPEYLELTHRLGVRVCGIWGGWSSKPPYKPVAPSLELCQKLGMGWLTGTPVHSIEEGKKEYDETALREGAHNFIEEYGKFHPIVDLGNEPHGKGARVLANVEAYRIVYEEIKKTDPSIFVLATSVEPNEEYFQAGYEKWCDAFDFHIYEEYPNVRKTMAQYRELMKKYGVEKPIWSTELGLNSEGQTREAVAVELTKKFATFFAAGGANVTWFGLLYPDGDGTKFGTSGDSHNVFDCRYNRYCPRLDAVAYYNAVNAISIKKFAAEKQYPGGASAFLFRDRENRSLEILWKEKERQDVFVPLPGVNEVTVILVDGSRRTLNAGGKGISLSLTHDPLLLLFEGGGDALAEALGTPPAKLVPLPQAVLSDKTIVLSVALDGAAADAVGLIAPPFWTVDKTAGAPGLDGKPVVSFTLTAPEKSALHALDLTVTLTNAQGQREGELYYRVPVK